jgi:hypothetical protein
MGSGTAIREALETLLKQSESYVNLSRARGQDLRPEAADQVRNAMAQARLVLAALVEQAPTTKEGD